MNATKQVIGAGSYFYTSWGYDQTNIDYLVVIEVSKTGKTAKCKMVSPIYVGAEGIEDVLMPATAYGQAFTMRVKQFDDGRTYLRGSYPYISNMPEAKRMDCFFGTNISETRNQTMVGFGH